MNLTNRFRHQMHFTMRVWPRGTLAVKAMVKGKEWSVDGMTYNVNERLEVVHKFGYKSFAAFELANEDAEKLMAVGEAGAVMGDLTILCPGTASQTVKQECRLDVNVTVYPDAASVKPYMEGPSNSLYCDEEDVPAALERRWAKMEKALVRKEVAWHGRKGEAYAARMGHYAYNGHVIVENPQLVDIDVIARQILGGKAILFDARKFTGKMVRLVRDRLDYYVVPGAKPNEEGGLFKGYQLGGYVFRYHRKDTRTPKDERQRRTIAKMNTAVREKGQNARRTYFVSTVVNRIAHKYGISEQRTMMRFIEGGILDYLLRSYDKAQESGQLYIHSQPSIDLRGIVAYAVTVVSHIVEGMRDEEVSA